MRFVLSILSLMLFVYPSFAQNDEVWALNGSATVSVGQGLYLRFGNNQIDTFSNTCRLIYFINSASISNSRGEFQFSTNGNGIVNKEGELMLDQDKLIDSQNNPDRMDAVAQGSLIIPFNNDTNKYYLFHSVLDRMKVKQLLPPINQDREETVNLYYSVIDMSLDGGKGGLSVVRNRLIVEDTLTGGKLTACRHANGRDWWVLCAKYLSNKYYTLFIESDSVKLLFEQEAGSIHSYFNALGQASFSLDGSKYCMANYKGGVSPNWEAKVDLFNFDRCSGLLEPYPPILLPTQGEITGCSFSPSGRFLYISQDFNLYQYDIQTLNLQRIYPKDYPNGGRFILQQLAPDGKIYMSTLISSKFLQVINNPDSAGQACNLMVEGQPLSYFCSTIPTFPNFKLGKQLGAWCVPSAIDEQDEESGLGLYPNPARDVVTLDYGNIVWERYNTVSLKLTNAIGQVVYENVMPRYSGLHKVDVSVLPAGLYHAEVLGDGRMIGVSKVVVE